MGRSGNSATPSFATTRNLIQQVWDNLPFGPGGPGSEPRAAVAGCVDAVASGVVACAGGGSGARRWLQAGHRGLAGSRCVGRCPVPRCGSWPARWFRRRRRLLRGVGVPDHGPALAGDRHRRHGSVGPVLWWPGPTAPAGRDYRAGGCGGRLGLVVASAAGAQCPGRWAGQCGYAGNYRFALRGTDYLAADAPPSPFQHYWSLGVEEQFYLLWPALLIATASIGRPFGSGGVRSPASGALPAVRRRGRLRFRLGRRGG